MTNIKDFIKEQKEFYKSIVSINCPILNETIYFSSEGFQHLIYESNRIPRKLSEQYLKLKCLCYAPEVIKNCDQVIQRKTKRKVKGQWKDGIAYGLICEVEKTVKMRVIVEKIGTGKFHFKSIMPHDKKSKHNNKKHR